MRNFLIIVWIVLISFFSAPIITDYVGGSPENEVVSIIEKEAEADNIEITAVENQGNKSMYTFTAGNDFGVAIFSHLGDKYRYREGTMSNGEDHIHVNLDSGWDMYKYRVTSEGAEQTNVKEFSGMYKIYVIVAAVMVVVSIIAAINGVKQKKIQEEQRRKGLRQ